MMFILHAKLLGNTLSMAIALVKVEHKEHYMASLNGMFALARARPRVLRDRGPNLSGKYCI